MKDIFGILILTAIVLFLGWALIGIIETIMAPFKATAFTKPVAPKPLTANDLANYWLICDQKRVKLELAEARLRKARLAIKRSQRTTDFYEDASFNPATGLPMLTATMDVGGNDSSVIGGI